MARPAPALRITGARRADVRRRTTQASRGPPPAMPATDPVYWSEHLRRNLQLYDEPLLRQVAGRLIKPRNQWPAADLIKRMAEAAENAAVIDRRLAEASPAGRQLL